MKIKSQDQKKLEQAYKNVVESESQDQARRKKLINFIQELTNDGDPDNVLSTLSIDQLQNIYNRVLASHKSVEAAISDWENLNKEGTENGNV